MRLVQYLILLSVLSPRPAVYVKGHSQAANQVRRNIATLTCFSSGTEPNNSAGILHVDHIQGMSGRSWVVMVLTDLEHNVVYQKKAEENPWPLPSAIDGLLKNLARSTCQGRDYSPVQRTLPQHSVAPSHPPVRGEALLEARPH